MGWMDWAGRSRDAAAHRETERECDVLRAENETLDTKIDSLQDQLRRALETNDALSADLMTEQKRAEIAEASSRVVSDTLREAIHTHATTLLHERKDAETHLASARASIAELRTRAEIAQNNFEWSRLMLNKSEEDRVALTHHILKTPMPVFALERQQVVEPPPAAEDGSGIKTPVKDRAHEETAIGGMAERFGVNFDDIGDEAAAREGLQHDEDGTVILAGR